MDLIIDANILFAALIRDNISADLLFEENLRLFSPDFIAEEFIKHESLISEKTSRTKENLIQIMHMLMEIITIIPEEEYMDFMEEAKKISPDKDDETYIALALKLKCGIWSNDKKLKQQDKIKVYSTEEIVELFKK